MTSRDNQCPCCGQSWPPSRSKLAARRRLSEVAKSPVQARVLECLLQNFGEWVTRARLIDFVYSGYADGGPDDANNTMAAHVNRLRIKVAQHGFEIEGRSWYGSRLRWKPAEAAA